MPELALSPDMLPAPGQSRLLLREGLSIALFNVDQQLHALHDSCPHAGASLAGGKVAHGAVQCPAHGLWFDLATGCMRSAQGFGTPTYPVACHNGQWVISLPDRGPSPQARACSSETPHD